MFRIDLHILRHSRQHGFRFASAGLKALCLFWLVAFLPKLPAAELAPAGEVRDVLLLLDTGPLHLRVRVAVGGKSPRDVRQDSVARLIKTLDTDNNGKLSRAEAQRSPLFREKQRPGAEKFIASLNADLTLLPRDIEQRMDRLGGETVIYRQNTTASDSDSIVFKLLDANSDGVVDGDEMFDAEHLLLARDLDDDECVMLDEFAPAPDPMPVAAVNPLQVPQTPVAAVASLLRDTHQTLLPAQLIQQYDRNRDRKLSTGELNWSAARMKACDLNGDGMLDLRELSALQKSPTDVELAVDVVRATDQPMLQLISTAGQRSDGERNPDLATITLPTAIITFSAVDVDPFAASMEIALRTFNELDQDNNGYLDPTEAALRERFARGLFDQIDVDGDGKIFGEEMKEFIRSRGEPVATSCQVTVFDDGAGFFATLDTNGDRRISMREMRYAEKSLTTMQRDDKPGLNENEPVRRYRIVFARGIFDPFGAGDRPNPAMPGQPEVVTVSPPRVGPIWFQRWDRNNDGDISWREFLGPRDAFERLDADRDDLLDPQEAAEAAQLFRSAEMKTAPTVSSGP